MQPDQVRLAIDYGAACTQAVVAWPDGRWEPLSIDGAWEFPSAVHTGAPGGVLVGEAAWRQAAASAEGFVASPLADASIAAPGTGEGQGSGAVAVAELAAATLRRVATVAADRVGGPVADVRMIVPAGWGPRRRTWLRRVAYQAGLGQPRLVEAPVAAASRLLAVGVRIPVGAFLLICDMGAGCEASVLRRGPTGFEVLSTLADREAGAAAIDARLTTALNADENPEQTAGSGGARWARVASLRAARETLSQQTVVQVPMPAPAPFVVLHSQLLDELAAPVLQRAADLAAQAVAAAELTVDQLAGSYLIGGTAVMPSAARQIGTRLGTTLQVVAKPSFAAVLGAADADARPAATNPTTGTVPAVPLPPVPRLRRLSGIVLPGVMSLALYAHMVGTATFNNGTPSDPTPYYYVLANWGELAVASMFALIGCLAAGSWFGDVLTSAQYRDGTRRLPTLDGPGGHVAGGIAIAVTAGLSIAALYGVTAAVFFALPLSRLLRWSLLPILPTAVIAAIIIWAARRRLPPPRGWDAYLAFPASSIICTTAGLVLVATWWHGPIPPVMSGWWDTIGRFGGMLMGIGIACTVVRTLSLRIPLGLVMAGFGFLLIARGPSILSITYAVAVALWWAYRLWLLLRLTPKTSPPARTAQHPTPTGYGDPPP